MNWGAIKSGTRGAIPRPTLIVATAALVLSSLFHCRVALALADCSADPAALSAADSAVGGRSVSLHPASLRSALRTSGVTPAPVPSHAACRRGGSALVSMASALLPRSYVARPLVDGYSVAASGTVTREMRIDTNPYPVSSQHSESTSAASASLESESGLEARFGVRWQTMLGPAWVQHVPSWVIQDAKTYHRRGLPLLHLWESSNYVVALGLSNHGVPGVYFSQKLP
jgi:hypothetical protein